MKYICIERRKKKVLELPFFGSDISEDKTVLSILYDVIIVYVNLYFD